MTIDEIGEILLSFEYKDENENLAKEYFTKMYRYYGASVNAIVKDALNKMGAYNKELLDASVANAFLNVYQYPKLEFEVKGENSPDDCFIAYLVTIARNEILKVLKTKSNNKLVYLDEDLPEVAFDDVELEERLLSVNEKMLNDALNTLKPEHKEIILALYNYHEEGKKTPTEVLDALCKTYGTTRDNIRQIKTRGVKKIIEYFSKHSNLIPLKNDK